MVRYEYAFFIFFIILNISCNNNPTASNKNDSIDNKFETGTVTDIDGNIYQTVKIGEQWWMAENLRVTHYRNGQPILHVAEREKWENLTTGAFCDYDNNPIYTKTFGHLYNYFAVSDSQELAPNGWHIPNDREWKELEKFLGLEDHLLDTGWRGKDEGGKLKKSGYAYWDFPNKGATNISGFSALPGGLRNIYGFFENMNKEANFWTSSGYIGHIGENSYYFSRSLSYEKSTINRKYLSNYNYAKLGFSVRCIKDNND